MAAVTVLPPFLQKLKKIAETIPEDVSTWTEDGDAYVVKDSDKFEQALKKFYKGSLQTFVRQLHFYGFRKLETQTGAWSFTHPNFRRDRPELLSDIRRKSRADAQMTATQVEVQQLKSQVAHLQGVVEDLRTQLDSVLNVLDDAGIVSITRGATSSVDGKESVKVAAKAGGASRKRSRIIQGTAGAPDTEATKITQRSPAPAASAQQASPASSATSATNSPAPAQNNSAPVAITQPVTPSPKENHTSSTPRSINDSENAPINNSNKMETEPAVPLSRAASFGELCSNIEPLDLEETATEEGEADLEILGDFELGEEADLIYRELMAAQNQDQRESENTVSENRDAVPKTTADLVAQATELDPKSVSKVLGFLHKAVNSQDSEELSEELSLPQIQRAFRAYKRFAKASPLPAQQVRA
mmetsp:Transcript_16713/g.32468  ORF Transcript_16713/g.32468 Transcript_16713/m.32468 type:complete len:416 (+) Transcript_16713:762-2009(+)